MSQSLCIWYITLAFVIGYYLAYRRYYTDAIQTENVVRGELRLIKGDD